MVCAEYWLCADLALEQEATYSPELGPHEQFALLYWHRTNNLQDEAYPARSRSWYFLQAPRRGALAKGPVRPRDLRSRLHPEQRVRLARRRPGDQGPPQVHGRTLLLYPHCIMLFTNALHSSTASPPTLLPFPNNKLSSAVPAASTTAPPARRYECASATRRSPFFLLSRLTENMVSGKGFLPRLWHGFTAIYGGMMIRSQ